MKDSILEEADELINGPRAAAYGEPGAHFTQVAKVWSGLIQHKLKQDVELEASDVCFLMASLKIVRETNRKKRDNRRDAAGYIGCADLVGNWPSARKARRDHDWGEHDTCSECGVHRLNVGLDTECRGRMHTWSGPGHKECMYCKAKADSPEAKLNCPGARGTL